MPIFPQCAATEQDGPQFDPPRSNCVDVSRLTRLREAGRRMSVEAKLTRETAGFHREAARRHGLMTERGLAHYKAARAIEGGSQKMMEFFNQGQQAPLDPKAQFEMHNEAMKFHKKQAEKHGLDTDQGHAHVQMMQQHMKKARDLKQKAQQQKSQQQDQQGGVSGRQSPMPVPKKSEMPNKDIRQTGKPVVKLQQKKASGKSGNYVAQRYDQSHPEGFKKTYN